MKKIVYILISFPLLLSVVFASDDPLTLLRDDTMLYFKPMTGTVDRVTGDTVVMKSDATGMVRPGMRLKVLREGAPFIHPVTKELLGRVEATVGKVEVREVLHDAFEGIIVEGEAAEGDKVRISETKIKLLFCQDKSIDWYLADEYYRKLKSTERIEMLDTALKTDDQEQVLAEARRLGADVALLMTAKESGGGTLVREQLFWVTDGKKFIDEERRIDVAYAKELKFGDEYFVPGSGEVILSYNLPFGARLLSSGDFDGDGEQEIVLVTNDKIRAYKPLVDLQFLWELKVPSTGELVWIDSVDLNKNGKDEIIVTTYVAGTVFSSTDELRTKTGSSNVVSYVYERDESDWKKLWEGDYFLRRLGSRILAQSFSDAEGYAGNIHTLTWEGEYKTGEKLDLPSGVNIYDFVYIKGDESRDIVFSYDKDGFLNVYDEKGLRLWRSSSNVGGFITKFKKHSTVVYLDKGEWSIKDRLIGLNKEVLVVERIPLATMATAIGYKSSQLRSFWWNGLSMEGRVLIDDIQGSLLDYTVVGDKIMVLSSPFLGIKFDNILKGENPLVTLLRIYSAKGR